MAGWGIPHALCVDAPALAIGTLVDHYKTLRPIGRGGMGEVFLARDLRLGRRVALKLVHPERLGDTRVIDRFVFEAQVTARFSHPHIVTIYGVGAHGGSPYLALEYLEGSDLRERIERNRPSPRQFVRIGLAIADALKAAHEHGVLHRDLKPENVLIPRDGRLRVVDFGLAKALSQGQTSDAADALSKLASGDQAQALEMPEARFASASDNVLGTPAYMAPEQADLKQRLIDQLREQPTRLGLVLQQLAEVEKARVLLLVDHLEELYAVASDEHDR